MNRWHLFLVFLVFPAIVLAQTSRYPNAGPNYASQPYTPAVPAPSMTTYGGYGGYAGGTTVAGSAMNGLGNAMSGKGNESALHLGGRHQHDAGPEERDSEQTARGKTYFQMRNENTAWNKAQQGPPVTKEQIARFAREGVPEAGHPERSRS